jgi:hypothetical protein
MLQRSVTSDNVALSFVASSHFALLGISQVFNAEFEDQGGFQSLYLKMLASGVPTSIETMWIPLSEWPTERLVQLPFKIVWWLLEDLWNSNLVVSVRPWYIKTAVGAVEEVMVRFGFPTIQRIVPQKVS